MKTASAYHIGRRHEQAGEKYQDAVQYYHDDYITIIAVADGCSSAKAAKEAADINVQTAVDFLKSENAWRISSKKAFKAALLDKIEEAFRQVPFETDELSATLAAVAIRSDGMFTAFSVTVQLWHSIPSSAPVSLLSLITQVRRTEPVSPMTGMDA